MPKRGRGKKAKGVPYRAIPATEAEPWAMLAEMRAAHHADLEEARIGLAWRKEWKANWHGMVILGKCVKVGALQKEFAAFDFVIVLNEQVWKSAEFTGEKKRALMDHELCHAAPARHEDGELVRDERGRATWRMRKHSIEEFHEIVERHGCYKGDLEAFAKLLLEKQAAPLLANLPSAEQGVEAEPGSKTGDEERSEVNRRLHTMPRRKLAGGEARP